VLSDDRLLAKLATGDIVAIEAKYHTNCLNGNSINSLVQIVRTVSKALHLQS